MFPVLTPFAFLTELHGWWRKDSFKSWEQYPCCRGVVSPDQARCGWGEWLGRPGGRPTPASICPAQSFTKLAATNWVAQFQLHRLSHVLVGLKTTTGTFYAKEISRGLIISETWRQQGNILLVSSHNQTFLRNVFTPRCPGQKISNVRNYFQISYQIWSTYFPTFLVQMSRYRH